MKTKDRVIKMPTLYLLEAFFKAQLEGQVYSILLTLTVPGLPNT